VSWTAPAAILGVSSSLGYLLPAIIGLESMGIPSPGETALVLAAVLASQGKLDIHLVILIGVASAVIGDNLGFLLGRHFGREVLEARGPFHRRRVLLIRYGDRFFERHGPRPCSSAAGSR
jgi:membrane protein DedA with SNARE-associated domain